MVFAEKHPEFDLEWEKQIFPSDITDGFILQNLSRGADKGKKDIASYSFEELQEEMLAIGEKDSAVETDLFLDP